ncbi:ciliary microtubule inner protein 2C [Hoplias malabaricus]|uniref:ciliary microtubule inner protein 2C n=1 Tax=Hoplias malabaricus TaxID=27720 RepID=UPI0034629651
MSATTRSRGSVITHNNATYIPASLMPGYTGHVPTSKFQYGVTYGNATIRYFLDSRCAAINPSTSPYSSDGMIPTSSCTGCLDTTLPSRNRDRNHSSPYWARYNIDYERQREIKTFSELAQKHRDNYRDKTGTLQPVGYFIVPVKVNEKFSWETM